MESDLATLVRELSPRIIPRVIARVLEESPREAATVDREETGRRVSITLDAFSKALAKDPPSAYADFWRTWSYVRSTSGVSLPHMRRVHLAISGSIEAELKAAMAGDPVRQLETLEQCALLFQDGVFALFEGYEQAKDALIRAQKASIKQLSTPIIPVLAGVLVVPLVGILDAERASDMIEQLLGGVARARAAVVIIDVTGVPIIDAGVADHLLRAARASELLGAKVLLVGVSPEAAQTLVALDMDLRSLRTLPDLQSGVAVALRAQGLAIRPLR